MHLIDLWTPGFRYKTLFLVQIHNTSLKFVLTVNFQPNSNKCLIWIIHEQTVDHHRKAVKWVCHTPNECDLTGLHVLPTTVATCLQLCFCMLSYRSGRPLNTKSVMKCVWSVIPPFRVWYNVQSLTVFNFAPPTIQKLCNKNKKVQSQAWGWRARDETIYNIMNLACILSAIPVAPTSRSFSTRMFHVGVSLTLSSFLSHLTATSCERFSSFTFFSFI